MLVGQAPGQTEVVDQRPFAGRAGRTLFKWLERAGLDEARARDVLFIAAITRCYPGPSPSGRGDRVPSRRERDLCADWLDGELTALRPPLLIPVGRLAIERFLGPVALDEVVGRAIPIEHPGGKALAIALPHPSGASSWIHQDGHMRLVDDALALLRAELVGMGLVSRTDGGDPGKKGSPEGPTGAAA
jgi:uracil-DNA glycosylase